MANGTDADTFLELSTWGSAGAIAEPIRPSADPTFVDCPWYRCWVLEQLQGQPQHLLQCLPDVDFDKEANWTTYLVPFWDKVRELVLAPGSKDINSIADTIIKVNLVDIKNNYEGHQSVKNLVFAVLGWQTMLYKPDFSRVTGEYAILNEMDGFAGEARVCLRQLEMVGRNSLPEFLLGFGMMLPPQNYCAFEASEQQALFTETKVVVSKEINAHVLSKVCGVRFQWVDSLSCHLELDTRSNTLFVFRYPSFCVSSIRQNESPSAKDDHKSVIHCCVLEEPGFIQWADEEDVTDLLREILLSYRLIFGQNKRSRAQFRKLRPFSCVPDGQDQLLSQLCGRKRFDCPMPLTERDEYDLIRDFPHLRSRIVRLSGYASSKRPRSIRQLWEDKRDSTAWLAFWSVLIFGSATIFLALIQTVFQILQYIDGLQNSQN